MDRASQLAKDQPRDGTALFSDILRDIYTPVTDGWSSLDCVMQESTEKIDFLIYDKTGLSGRGRLFFKANGERTAL